MARSGETDQAARPHRDAGQVKEEINRAFKSFIAVPTLVIAGFMVLAVGTYALDHAGADWAGPLGSFMERNVFGSSEATSALLGTIAGGIITVTSITFSLLLLALQQSAASMTHQVFDQFLRRKLNQFYFGFFIGVAIFALLILATVAPSYNPVYGATLALLLTIGALYVLLLLIYATITQMRPDVIIASIHDLTLLARERQLPLIRQTYRASQSLVERGHLVRTSENGFVVDFDVKVISAAIENATNKVEVECLVSVGAYVAYQDAIAVINVEHEDDEPAVAGAVRRAFSLERSRKLDGDPAYGIEQLETIAWTSISTSKQNPSPGLLVIHNLRELLARWSEATDDDSSDEERLPVVYPDNVMGRLMGAFESLAVVASESMQHQVYAEIVQSIATMYDRLPAAQQSRAKDVILRTIPALGDHVLTRELDNALNALVQTLEKAGRWDTASTLQVARHGLAETIGKLNSRATRVPSQG